MGRKAGILLPISALPSPYGIGTLGKEAYAFIDFLSRAGMKVWQMLPLLPTSFGDSPYQSYSANALNYYFIDLRLLEEDGLLRREEYAKEDFGDDPRRADYGKLFRRRISVLKKAFARSDKNSGEWVAFLKRGAYRDFALFMALKEEHDFLPWQKWEKRFRDCETAAIKAYGEQNREKIEFWEFTQYLFIGQWKKLKTYANGRGISLMGDMPIYLSSDSAEAWKYREKMFLTDENGNFSPVAGVPPDAFSEDGQLWGNPLYDWEKMQKNGYAWWKKRIDDSFEFFDVVRIDHFRGFDRFYAIPFEAESAKTGVWLDGPKADLFKGREHLFVVAEDLGSIDDGVRALLKETGYPSMKVMLFGFGDENSEHKPSRYEKNIAAYTGTHDNEPFCGYLQSLSKDDFLRVKEELKTECEKLGVPFCGDDAKTLTRVAVELLFASSAETVVIPLHDVFAFGDEARINYPSTLSAENWSYRFLHADFSRGSEKFLRSLAVKYRR